MATPPKSDGQLDLGDVSPGVQAGYPRPRPGVHPWSKTAFDYREGREASHGETEG